MIIFHSIFSLQEPYVLSFRQIQLAKHTPTQVIKLAYLCALLEQQQTGALNHTRRLLKVTCFLEEAVKVVPVESVLNAIAYARHDIAMDCATALKQSKLTLQPTRLMVTSLMQALFRAIYGFSEEVMENIINNTDSTPDDPVRSATPVFTPDDVLRGAFGGIPDLYHSQPNTNRENPTHPITQMPNSERPYTSNQYPLYSHVASGESSADVQSLLPRAHSLFQQQTPELLPMHDFKHLQVVFQTIMVNKAACPEPICFPKDITDFLRESFYNLMRRRVNLSGRELEVVGKTNLEEIYPTSRTIRRNMHFTSPRTVLAQSIAKLDNYIKEAGMEVNLARPKETKTNKEMLKLLNGIYNYDVALCAALLGSFMERHIQIPFLKSPEVTAQAVSSPIAVGVWALFSVSRDNLQEMLASSNNTELVVKVKEYMHSVLTDQPQDDDLKESEEKMYAGKLQFLLQGMHKTVTSSTKYISYSLEYQLCENLKFPKDISVQDLISQWKNIFKNDILFHVAESHRPLLARWLKWAVLIHDLREVLAEYTCIGVTGLINSGKSLLIKQLFHLKVCLMH